MTEQALYLDQLTPLEALELLALALDRPDLEPRQLQAVRLEQATSVFGASATLVLPLTDSEAAWTAFVTACLERFARLRGAEPLRAELRTTGLTLSDALAWLLLESGGDSRARAEPCQPAEFLLVADHLELAEVATFFEDLRFHCTQIRVAAARDQFFFHILDDEARRSSFQSLVASDALRGCRPLAAFPVAGRQFFLPAAKAPDQRALAHLLALLERFPSLLHGDRCPTSGPVLAIDRQAPDATEPERYHIFPLAQLTFHSQLSLERDSPNAPSFAHYQPQDQAGQLARLRDALYRAAPSVGYRLELRATRQRESAEVERRRLLERQAEIAYKLAYLDSVSRPRPQLLRFSDDQLPALAELIRAFPLEVLQQGYPRYAYLSQTLEGERPRSYHWIYLEPQDATLGELDPFLRWGTGPNKPRRYGLDPFWSRHYHSRRPGSLVFVPEQTALFPAMHAWSAADMDSYLREAIATWSGTPLDELPAQPLLVFGPETGVAAELVVALLDLEAFQPLRTRLGWINDHLALAKLVPASDLVAELADKSAQALLAERVVLRHRNAEQELEELLLEANRLTHRKISELTETVNAEMNLLLERTHETLTFLANLHDYLEELTQLRQRAEASAGATHKTITKTEHKYTELGRFILRLEADLERELQHADQVRQRANAKVQNSIAELETNQRDLKRRLLELLRMKL